MALWEAQEPIKTLRGTWEQVREMSREIPASSEVEIRIYEPKRSTPTPTMTLLQSWLDEDATDDPDDIRVAEQELTEFKRNMNQPRKAAGARLLYPEAEAQ
jgi:hypothetical protein